MIALWNTSRKNASTPGRKNAKEENHYRMERGEGNTHFPFVGSETSGSGQDSNAAWHVRLDDQQGYLEGRRRASCPSSGLLDYPGACLVHPYLGEWAAPW